MLSSGAILKLKIQHNAFVPLGEVTVLPDPLACFQGRFAAVEEQGGKGNVGKDRKGWKGSVPTVLFTI